MPASDSSSKGTAWQGNVSSAASATEMRLLGSANNGQSTCAVAQPQKCVDVAVRGSSARGEDARRGRTRNVKCKHPLGCELFASFGAPGDKARFCAAHKAAHHTNVGKSCLVHGCSARPLFGVDNVLTHCGAHRSLSFRTRVSACVWSCVRECARARP